MQTFLPYADFYKSLSSLDNQRLGKQRVEARQILFILLWKKQRGLTGFDNVVILDTQEELNELGQLANKLFIAKPMNSKRLANMLHWQNHPAVKMWSGAEGMLARYAQISIAAWVQRGFRNNMPSFIPQDLKLPVQAPKWLGNYWFHRAHRRMLLTKKYDYYAPIFHSSTEPKDAAYIWPTSANDNLAEIQKTF